MGRKGGNPTRAVFKEDPRILSRLFATWAEADCCLMSCLCIMGFVWRDSNRSEGFAMQLFDILFQNVAINIKVPAFV